MYLDEMIAQVPSNRHYSKRHLDSVPQMLQLIDEVLTMAPEYSQDAIGLAGNVQRQDQFWIKSQPSSLQDMLADDESAEQFAGGTVYQAFLSAANYHR